MANIVPDASAEFETSLGVWAAWFSCTAEQSTEQANNGTGSMKITATSSNPAVQTNNWPGFSSGVVAGHTYEIHWHLGKFGGPSRTMTLNVFWRNESGTNLAEVNLPITTVNNLFTQSAVVESTAPTGATRLFMTITSSGFASGNEVHVDSIVVDDEPDAGGEDHDGDGLASVVALTPSSGVGSPTIAVDGEVASITIVAGQGDGTTSVDVAGGISAVLLIPGPGEGSSTETEQHDGDGLPASVILDAGSGAGSPSAAGSGSDSPLVIIPGAGVGAATLMAGGQASVVHLAPQVGEGTSSEPQHSSGDGLSTALILTSVLGQGSPIIDGAGATAPLTLAVGQGAGSLSTSGDGVAVFLMLTVGVGAGFAGLPPPVPDVLRLRSTTHPAILESLTGVSRATWEEP